MLTTQNLLAPFSAPCVVKTSVEVTYNEVQRT